MAHENYSLEALLNEVEDARDLWRQGGSNRRRQDNYKRLLAEYRQACIDNDEEPQA